MVKVVVKVVVMLDEILVVKVVVEMVLVMLVVVRVHHPQLRLDSVLNNQKCQNLGHKRLHWALELYSHLKKLLQWKHHQK